jgi:hypothetical protein
MKRALAAGVLAVLALGIAGAKDKEGSDVAAAPAVGLRHVVMFKYKDGTSQADMDKVLRAFLDMKKGIPSILDVEGGVDCGTEGLSDGYQHCYIVSFADEAGRDTYLKHGEHSKFVELVKPFLDKVHVIDFKPTR